MVLYKCKLKGCANYPDDLQVVVKDGDYVWAYKHSLDMTIKGINYEFMVLNYRFAFCKDDCEEIIEVKTVGE